MIGMPGRSHRGALPPLSPEGKALAERLRKHVVQLSKAERNVDLDTPARYIETALGPNAASHYFESGGRKMRNIELACPQTSHVVVGAHYDTVPGSPGADDNASGVAALIELVRLLGKEGLPIRFVAFANEEVAHLRTPDMGSWSWAERAKERGEDVRAMLSLEMLGYYDDALGSQHYPAPLRLFYPDRANFIAFVGDLGARRLVRKAIASFRRNAAFPSEGLAAPSFIPGVTWSDHWPFRQHGFPAIMVTDTSFYRYAHYHLPSDTAEKLDYERLARVTLGLAGVLRDLASKNR
ncbi:MAG: M20/M25/M40 family metallo-hydrolase [Betaproteobacteria bacterium]|nr:MAG: M20/M25/M40 family metallo-hydrolase [Betaproteobacteria bacterium]